jgi:hypothetical protein
MEGKVVKTGQSPSLTTFKWGFVQSVEEKKLTRKWYPLSKDKWEYQPPDLASTIQFPKFYFLVPCPENTNDSYKGKQLYADHKPFALGEEKSRTDSPMSALEIVYENEFQYGVGKTMKAKIPFVVNKPNEYDGRFSVWQVVFSDITKQYVPLKQKKWSIKWDTDAKDENMEYIKEWQAKEETPPQKMEKPSDKTTSSYIYSSVLPGPADTAILDPKK